MTLFQQYSTNKRSAAIDPSPILLLVRRATGIIQLLGPNASSDRVKMRYRELYSMLVVVNHRRLPLKVGSPAFEGEPSRRARMRMVTRSLVRRLSLRISTRIEEDVHEKEADDCRKYDQSHPREADDGMSEAVVLKGPVDLRIKRYLTYSPRCLIEERTARA